MQKGTKKTDNTKNMKFSVTIPAYKSRFLDEAIKSVISQSYSDWELIIVDDCSPEDIVSIVKPYLTDSRISYHRNKKNCGAVDVVDNWNICLSYCTGDYVICMGDDDRLLPCCLEEYATLISKYPLVTVLHAWTEIIDENGSLIAIQQPRTEWESALSLIWNRWNSRKHQFIGDFCFKTQNLIEKGGYYKLPLAWGSDEITAVRAAMRHGIANTQKFCFQYRQNSLTITSSKKARIKMQATLKEYEWFMNYLHGLDEKKLNDVDRNYYKTIMSISKNRYKNIAQNCIDDLHGNPFRLPYWYKNLKVFGFPKSFFLRCYLRSIF